MALARQLTRFSGLLRNTRNSLGSIQHGRNYAEEAPKPVSSSEMSFSFGMPGNMFYKQESVKQVDVPSTTGSFGILPQHVPSLAVLKPGVVVVTEDNGEVNRFFVSSGSVTINEDSSVQIIAEAAYPVDQLDPQAIKTGLATAQQELASAATDLARAEAQIAVEVHEAMEAAVSGK